MKTIIVYFTYSNNTKRLVEEVNQSFNFDKVRISRKKDYSKDYDTCAYIEAKKEWENRESPEIKFTENVDFSNYERILLFFPIWWYTYPMPIQTLLKGPLNSYKGEIYLFSNSYTDDPQYLENAFQDAKKANSQLTIYKGLQNKSVQEHIAFIRRIEHE